MILSTHPAYPNARSYVLKLHRDAKPKQGKVFGRLENVTTGEQFVFSNADELLACLSRDTGSTQSRFGAAHHLQSISYVNLDRLLELFALSRDTLAFN